MPTSFSVFRVIPVPIRNSTTVSADFPSFVQRGECPCRLRHIARQHCCRAEIENDPLKLLVATELGLLLFFVAFDGQIDKAIDKLFVGQASSPP